MGECGDGWPGVCPLSKNRLWLSGDRSIDFFSAPIGDLAPGLKTDAQLRSMLAVCRPDLGSMLAVCWPDLGSMLAVCQPDLRSMLALFWPNLHRMFANLT